MKSCIENCKIIKLPKVQDKRGNITFVEKNKLIPFSIKRIYYLYNIPNGAKRGGHGHKKLQQLIIAISGSFDVIVKDGKNIKKIHLHKPNFALYIPKMIWREIINFSSKSVCLVLASKKYSSSDYLESFKKFKALKNK